MHALPCFGIAIFLLLTSGVLMSMFENAVDHSLDVHLLNDFQRDFPLCPAPFAELAARLGVAEGTVLRLLEQLRREGKISRVGAVFAPKRIGASTLVAMCSAEGAACACTGAAK